MSDTPEVRYLEVEAEVRLLAPAKTGAASMIVGYAAKFGVLSHDLGGFRETVLPGAFSRSLKSPKEVIATWDHNPAMLLGTAQARTLRLQEDERGLRYEIDIPDTAYARDLAELLRRGDVRGSSFKFVPARKGGEEWRMEKDVAVRSLKDVTLLDVSVVTRPAYPSTEVALRSLQDWQRETSPRPLDLLRRRLDLAERR